MSEKYQGWTNYETWCAALWINNDQGSYEWAREIAGSYEDIDAEGLTPEEIEDARHDMRLAAADELAAWYEEFIPELSPSFYSDVLRHAFDMIDWYEIAESVLEE